MPIPSEHASCAISAIYGGDKRDKALWEPKAPQDRIEESSAFKQG